MSLHEIVISPCSVYMYFSLQYGYTALMWASLEGRVECVKLLLDKGASADLLDKVRCGVTSSIVCVACSLGYSGS